MTTSGDGPYRLARPAYGEAGLADVLPGALAALGVTGMPDPLGLATGALAGVDRVAVLLVDGLGWCQVRAAAGYAPALADLVAGRGGVPPRVLTTGFPSTTPTSLVSLGTGAAPGRHGVLGFTVNVPGTDRVLTHIAWRDDPDPARWQPVPSLFDRATAAGVATTVVASGTFRGSGLTVATWGRPRYVPASGVEEVAAGMTAALAAGPGLVYGYHGAVDHAGHVYGLASAEWAAAAAEADALVGRLVAALPRGSALLVTADHGMLDVPPGNRLDMAAVPELAAGVRVVAGEARVRYLHAEPGAGPDVLAAWRAVLGDIAWVGTREEAVAEGWYGPVPPQHLARIGDVVAVCRADHAVFATGWEPPTVARLVGLHGGLTRAELEIPLLVARG